VEPKDKNACFGQEGKVEDWTRKKRNPIAMNNWLEDLQTRHSNKVTSLLNKSAYGIRDLLAPYSRFCSGEQ
jgi:hypothetical protein